MNKTKLMSFSNYDLYLVIDNNLTYYISIPKVKMFKNILTISLDSNSDILNNDINKISESLKSLYEDTNNTNSVLIIPCIEEYSYNKLRNEFNEEYKIVAKYITKIINSAYKILRNLNIELDINIKILDNNLPFIDWFIEKYESRIKKTNIIDLVSDNSLGKKVVVEKEDLQKVNASGINFIVGNNDIDPDSFKNLVEIKNPFDEYSKLYNEPVQKRKLANAAGNVSYYLIGSLVVVTALIILSLIMK